MCQINYVYRRMNLHVMKLPHSCTINLLNLFHTSNSAETAVARCSKPVPHEVVQRSVLSEMKYSLLRLNNVNEKKAML
jgi:hypothetical protein